MTEEYIKGKLRIEYEEIMRKKITELFKPYIVKRSAGNCQVLFPLTELDNLVDKIIEEV